MNKLDKIDQQEQKAREKITAMQAILKQIGEQRTEQENLQIIAKIRALKLPREELYAFLRAGDLSALAGAIGGNAAEEPDGGRLPETVYSRRGKPRKDAPDAMTGTDADTQDETDDAADDDESEVTEHEE